MRNNLLKVLGLVLVISACGTQKEASSGSAESEFNISDQLLMSTLWVQSSAEAELLCRQGFAYAWQMVQYNQANMEAGGDYAVVVDIDETILDNSPYEAQMILNKESYTPESWATWVKQANADMVPGAREFLLKVEDMGIAVFYVSNRSVKHLDPTIQNLMKHNLPFATPDHVYLKEESSDKTERRERINHAYTVLAYVGDQVTDFSQELGSMEYDTFSANKGLLEDVMKQFVILPNPMYGSFESRLYNGQRGLDNKTKDQIRRAALRSAPIGRK